MKPPIGDDNAKDGDAVIYSGCFVDINLNSLKDARNVAAGPWQTGPVPDGEYQGQYALFVWFVDGPEIHLCHWFRHLTDEHGCWMDEFSRENKNPDLFCIVNNPLDALLSMKKGNKNE